MQGKYSLWYSRWDSDPHCYAPRAYASCQLGYESIWCSWRDLNPQSLRPTHLKRRCIPSSITTAYKNWWLSSLLSRQSGMPPSAGHRVELYITLSTSTAALTPRLVHSRVDSLLYLFFDSWQEKPTMVPR